MREWLTCRFKGHMWRAVGPTPNPSKGSYIVHRRCYRCGKYERLMRQAGLYKE